MPDQEKKKVGHHVGFNVAVHDASPENKCVTVRKQGFWEFNAVTVRKEDCWEFNAVTVRKLQRHQQLVDVKTVFPHIRV